MTSPRLRTTPAPVSIGRRGRVRETRGASGFPLHKPGDSGTARSVGSESMPLLLEAPDVARLLGLGRTKVYELIARRQIPTIRVGRCVRVPASALARWIEANTSP